MLYGFIKFCSKAGILIIGAWCLKYVMTEQNQPSTLDASAAEQFDKNDDKALLPIREDIAEWLSRLLGTDLQEDHLFDSLQTGTLLCQAACIICQKASKASATENWSPTHSTSLSPKCRCSTLPNPPRYFPHAHPGSFLARDNAANFISWCRALGVQETCMFESEGLVLQREPRNVLLCLLEVARIAVRYGVSPPELVRLEKDIEHGEMKRKKLLQDQNCENTPFVKTPPSLNWKKRAKVVELDRAVHKIVDNSVFRGLVDIERIGEGRYRVESKLVFIRMLRDRHVMVRVGGGWDTLEHYLSTHDSIRFVPRIKLLSVTDKQREGSTPQRMFRQDRNRIPLRTKQC